MFNLSFMELVVCLLVGLLVLGPKGLANVMRWFADMLSKARSMLDEVKKEFANDVDLDELKKVGQSIGEEVSKVKGGLSASEKRMEEEIERTAKKYGMHGGSEAWMNLPPLRNPSDFDTDGNLKNKADEHNVGNGYANLYQYDGTGFDEDAFDEFGTQHPNGVNLLARRRSLGKKSMALKKKSRSGNRVYVFRKLR